MTLAGLADAFFAAAPEFGALHGHQDDRGFTAALYRYAFEREADEAGLDYWIGHLGAGLTRAEMLLSFSESAEQLALTKAWIMNEAPEQFGILFAS